MFENVDGRTDGRRTDGRTTDAGVTGILIAHLGAFGSGELKTGEKITKYRHFTMFMFVVERAGPNSPNDTREITKYCKLPNGNVPLRQFSRIYSRRCRGVCNKHTWR